MKEKLAKKLNINNYSDLGLDRSIAERGSALGIANEGINSIPHDTGWKTDTDANNYDPNHRIWKTGEILPDTETSVFFLPNKYHKNREKYEEEKNTFQKIVSKSEDLTTMAKTQWIDNPEIVDIDLAKVHDLSYAPQAYFKTGRGLGSFYKDGILIRFNNKKNNSYFHLKLDGQQVTYEEAERQLPKTKLDKEFFKKSYLNMEKQDNFYLPRQCFEVAEITNNSRSLSSDMTYEYYDFKDWKKECFNNYNFPIYIMFENFSKIKAVKINLKNNKKINVVKNRFRKNNKCAEKNVFEYEYPQGIPFEIARKMTDAKSRTIAALSIQKDGSELHEEMQNSHNSQAIKKGFLQGSWDTAIEHRLQDIFENLENSAALSKEEILTVKKLHRHKIKTTNEKLKHFIIDAYDFIISYKGSGKRYQETKELMSLLEKHKRLDVTDTHTIECFMFDPVRPILERFFRKKNASLDTPLKNEKDTNKLIEKMSYVPLILNYIFLLLVLVYKTKDGTHLPNHKPIAFEDFSNLDCSVYWTHAAQILTLGYFKGISIEKKPPLVFDTEKSINTKKMHRDKLTRVHNNQYCRAVLPYSEGVYQGEEIKKIMEEAFNNEIYQVPWGAAAPVDDERFSYLQFFEFRDYFLMFAFDKGNRYFFEVYDKKIRQFVGYFFNRTQNQGDKIDETAKLIYVKFAEVIRDFKILIDRDVTMKYHGRGLPPIEGNFDGPLEIWLPRKRYRYKKKTANHGFRRIYHTQGFRIQHIRRLRIGTEASERALRAAKRANFTVREGHTYVRGAQWNKSKMSKREIIYRHKSLSGPFYVSDDEIKKVKKIDEMSGAAFEEHCKKYIQDRKLDVDTERNGDDGIDIVAYETLKNGEEVKVTIQCKNNRKKPVGKDIVREMKGSKEYQNNDSTLKTYYKGRVRGMIIASGGFTSGARKDAKDENIELVSDDLLK